MRYREKNDDYRSMYLETLSQIPKEKRVYVDETGFNEPLVREYGYGKKGEQVEGERSGKRFTRTSLIAGLKNNKPVAPMEFKGYCDTEVVLAWLQQMLIPALKPGDVVIWDNATFHRSPRLAKALSDKGIGLLFLSAYSPDLNPIEQFWAWLKAWIRALNQPFLHISEALTEVFKNIFN
jgi:transposase